MKKFQVWTPYLETLYSERHTIQIWIFSLLWRMEEFFGSYCLDDVFKIQFVSFWSVLKIRFNFSNLFQYVLTMNCYIYFCRNDDKVTRELWLIQKFCTSCWECEIHFLPTMAKGSERLPGTNTRIRTRDDGCCSVNFLKYVLHIYNVVLFVSTFK